MNIVTDAVNFPRKCVFTGDVDGPFLDTETWLNARQLDGIDPYAYISVSKVQDMGRAVGMVPRHEVEALQEQLAAYGDKVAELTRLLDAYTTIKDAEKELVSA